MVAVAGSGAAGVAVGGQVREVEPPKVIVANKAENPVPVTAVVSRMPVVSLEPGTTSGVTVSAAGATVIILKRQR